MDFRILGPLEARNEGQAVEIGGGKRRALLALLLLHANETVSTDRLIDGLWGSSPPATAAKAVQVHVSALRKTLACAAGDGAVVTREHGYELQLDPDRLDAHRFERLVAEGRAALAAGRAADTANALDQALALWHGRPLADLAFEPFAQRESDRLEDLRVGAHEDRIEAKLALGCHAEVVGQLEQLVAEHPHRERLRAQLMLTLYRCERQAEALRAYQEARRTLVDELGIEPGRRLRELERAILAHDPALGLEATEPTVPESARADAPPVPAPSPVRGRASELAAIDTLLAAARDGLQLLAIDGKAGIGKTILWREGIARARARGYRVLSCRAVQAEARLSFAGLADMLAPVEVDAYAALPAPQRHALEVALLRAEADDAVLDPRAIGTGLVSLTTALAARGPLLLAIDDLQWLDQPTVRALVFALRRIDDAPVAVLATRRPGEPQPTDALVAAVPTERARRVRLGPLDHATLYELLSGEVGPALTRPLLARIERASRGNPFYALELARAVKTAPALPAGAAFPVSDDLREFVEARLRALPPGTRIELLRASVLAQPSIALLDAPALVPAVHARVVSVDSDGRVEFVHPLFASAVHAAASATRLRQVHADLAEVVDDVEERARHMSLATAAPDAGVAEALDVAADRANRRGAPEVAAELAERAADLTPPDDEPARLERYGRAARHHYRAGDPGRAHTLAERVVAGSAEPRVQVAALYLLAEEQFEVRRAPPAIALLEEALTLVGDDVVQAVGIEMMLGLALAAIGEIAAFEAHLERAVELAESVGEPGLLAEAIGVLAVYRLSVGKGLDEESLTRALALEDYERDSPVMVRPSLNVAQAYEFTGRLDEARELLVRLRDRLTARGEESDLPFCLVQLAATSWLAGALERAETVACDALRVATLNDQDFFRAFALLMRASVRATRGDVGGSAADAAEASAISVRIGWVYGDVQARWGQALLALAQDDPATAVEALDFPLAAIEAVGIYEWALACPVPDGIEALVRIGDVERATRLCDAFAAAGAKADRPWALALSGRGHALIHAAAGELELAQVAAERALVHHERFPVPFERARTLLVLGQVKARRGDREGARESLERALAIFDEIGARIWAEKARAAAGAAGVDASAFA
jgi:DNA-binding SARP family transcriptional activator